MLRGSAKAGPFLILSLKESVSKRIFIAKGRMDIEERQVF